MIRPGLFVSYVRSDIRAADHLATHLEAGGRRPWLDWREILVGDDFGTGFEKELARCDGHVLFPTRRFAMLSWCQAETQRAGPAHAGFRGAARVRCAVSQHVRRRRETRALAGKSMLLARCSL
jgi:TIR domain